MYLNNYIIAFALYPFYSFAVFLNNDLASDASFFFIKIFKNRFHHFYYFVYESLGSAVGRRRLSLFCLSLCLI